MKYAEPKTLPPTSPEPAYCDSTLFLTHISKVIGRKKFRYELRVSKKILDLWLSGERKNPLDRTRDIMRVAASCYGPDLPLDIGQFLLDEFGGLVSMKRKPTA